MVSHAVVANKFQNRKEFGIAARLSAGDSSRMKLFRCSLAFCLCLALTAAADDFDSTTAPVGRIGAGLSTPVNQLVTPAGKLIELPGMRPQALALCPNGKLLVTAGLTHELVVLDPVTGRILQHVNLPPDNALKEQKGVNAPILDADTKAELSFTGLTFSPDGSRIYLSNVNGDIKVFAVARNMEVSPLSSILLPPANAPRRANEIPTGI